MAEQETPGHLVPKLTPLSTNQFLTPPVSEDDIEYEYAVVIIKLPDRPPITIEAEDAILDLTLDQVITQVYKLVQTRKDNQ